MKKSSLVALFLVFISTGAVWAADADVEGWITKVDYTKNKIVVLNELHNSIGLREYRVTLKQGRISGFKKNDRVRVWLQEDKTKAEEVEIIPSN